MCMGKALHPCDSGPWASGNGVDFMAVLPLDRMICRCNAQARIIETRIADRRRLWLEHGENCILINETIMQ